LFAAAFTTTAASFFVAQGRAFVLRAPGTDLGDGRIRMRAVPGHRQPRRVRPDLEHSNERLVAHIGAHIRQLRMFARGVGLGWVGQ